jgi:hypothetical protein
MIEFVGEIVFPFDPEIFVGIAVGGILVKSEHV